VGRRKDTLKSSDRTPRMSAEAQREESTATNAPRRRAQTAPGPRYATPFGAMAHYRRNPPQFYLDAARFGDVVRVQTGPWYSYLLTHPDHIQYVLQDNHQNYGRSCQRCSRPMNWRRCNEEPKALRMSGCCGRWATLSQC